ncbi:MAG: hypothetical protein OXI96_05555 [Acidimicrobiaceae bacterium]|nr:hypothetical protein [Acidimicrobiaceae bacterium]MDE0268486.1 hypothetical protein [Acidimicrobiaceae bacterium]
MTTTTEPTRSATSATHFSLPLLPLLFLAVLRVFSADFHSSGLAAAFDTAACTKAPAL